MAKSATSDTRKIPQRKDIREKDKWDLTILFKNDDEWENSFLAVQKLIKKASSFSGKLAKSPETLYNCLESREKLSILCFNLYQYATLNQDLDNRVSKYQAMVNKAAMLQSQASAAYSFVEPELMKISDSRLKQMSGKFPRTDIYDFYIKELLRSRKHIRSGEVEELLAQTSMLARGPEAAFTVLDNADIKYGSVTDEHGHEIVLTKQRFAKLMDSPSQPVRKQAHETLFSAYKNHINTLGAMLSTSINKDVFFSRARHYPSCLHGALDAYDIPVKVYHSLIETTEADLTALHQWMSFRKKTLKLKKIFPYDVYCPLFPEQVTEIPYDEAIAHILEAMAPLGSEYIDILKTAFARRWVDVYETEGKGGGAYNWGNYTAHPFVKMNYNNTIENMFTLAHEMGHALHSYLSNKKQPYPKAQYSIFVAEVASTLNEGLLLQSLLRKSDNNRQKLFLLNRHLNNTFTTFFHQVMYAHFELMVHELIEKGEALSPDKTNEMWENLTMKYYGPEVTMDEFSKFKWSRIPHFYRAFYVYQYATSYTASQAILDKFTSGDTGIIKKYLELLSSGGSDYPINQLKKCGVDMTKPEPVTATIKLFAEQVEAIEKLTRK